MKENKRKSTIRVNMIVAMLDHKQICWVGSSVPYPISGIHIGSGENVGRIFLVMP